MTNDSVAYFQNGKLLIFKTTAAVGAVHGLNPIESDTNKAGQQIFLSLLLVAQYLLALPNKYFHLQFLKRYLPKKMLLLNVV